MLVQAPEPERRLTEPVIVTDDALDAALAAAVSKAQQQAVEQDIPQRPVIESDDFDYENDPLAQSASPQPRQRGSLLFNATSRELYRAPSTEQLAELQRELGSRPEPTDDELADLMPEELAGLMEQSELKQETGEDEINLDELDDEPSGPSFG